MTMTAHTSKARGQIPHIIMVVALLVAVQWVFPPASLAQDTGPNTGQIQPITPADITGQWQFATEPFQACSIKGTMVIRQLADSHHLSCQFKAQQNCDDWPGPIHSAQSCTAVFSETDTVVIMSEIINVRVPSDDFIPELYRADNFRLTVQTPRLMTGSLLANTQIAVEFVREEELVS